MTISDKTRDILEWILCIVIAFVLAIVVKYFVGTPSRIEGIDLAVIEKETLERHEFAYDGRHPDVDTLPNEGDYKWRKYGERRLFSPEAVSTLQYSTREGNYAEFKKYSKSVDVLKPSICKLNFLSGRKVQAVSL